MSARETALRKLVPRVYNLEHEPADNAFHAADWKLPHRE
jgi:hypothetical protein